MTQQWDPQQTLEAPLALAMIQEQFPDLEATTIRLLGAGWDNTAFIINEDLIFRFPRRQIAVPFIEAEWLLLPKLAYRLPLPIPIPQWKGVPTASFTWPFIGYRMLPGITACKANLSEEERAALAEPIARFLACLHATPASLISGCQIPNDNQARIDWKVLTPKIQKNFEDISDLNLLENRKELESVVARLQNLRPPMSTAVVHGDFYVRHLLVNIYHQLAGVIDWGDIHLGDPAIDLSIAHSFLPASAHSKFRQAYGEISEDTWSLSLLRSIFSCTLLILFGHHTKDPAILGEGLRSLKLIATKKSG